MRQTFLTRRGAIAAASVSLAACAAGPRVGASKVAPTDFVLVHGAWHGAWCWRRVSDRLLAAGHRVWVPTLTGLSDRAHLMSPAVDLQTHIDDVSRQVQWENLDSIVLVGHSYGGMVVTGATEALGSRVRSLVYLDAFVPDAGESVVSISGAATEERLKQASASSNGLSLPPYPAKSFGVGDSDAPWVDAKMTPQPLKTFTGRIASVNARDRVPKKTYIRAAKFPSAAFDGYARRYAGQPGWVVNTWQEGHDLMIIKPDETAAALLQAAQT
jgi:pimeloyl-ACP methyl ester carboxylesterase